MKRWEWDPTQDFFDVLVRRHGHGGGTNLPTKQRVADIAKIDRLITCHGTPAEKREWRVNLLSMYS